MRRPRSRSTWAWCRAPSTTLSTRSGRRQHQPYLLEERTGAKASVNAAVATAAYDVLSNLVSTAPERAPFPGRAGLLATLATEYAASLGAIDNNAFKRQGIASGTWRPRPCSTRGWATGDSDRPSGPRSPASESGSRSSIRQRAADPRPDPVGGRREAVPHPELGQFRSAPPPALTARRGRISSTRSRASAEPTARPGLTDQTYFAKWWQSAPGLSWNEVARQLIARNGLDAADSARLLALLNLSGGRRGDQLLERQVPLRLLAAVERDHDAVGRWKRRHDDTTRRGRRSSPRRIPSGSRGTSP